MGEFVGFVVGVALSLLIVYYGAKNDGNLDLHFFKLKNCEVVDDLFESKGKIKSVTDQMQ